MNISEALNYGSKILFESGLNQAKLDAKLFLYHSANYKHGFDLQIPVKKLNIENPSIFDSLVMRSRIGKIMVKLKLTSGKLKIGNKIILDDYFQDPNI